jgi:hypothetical protein
MTLAFNLLPLTGGDKREREQAVRTFSTAY